MIGGNLTFGMGDGEPTNQDQALENIAGKSCGKFLWKNLAGNSCRKLLRENLAGKSCGKFLQENLAGQGGGGKVYLRKAVIGGNLAFGIG